MNPDWTIWSKASFATYVKALADSLEVKFTLDQLDSSANLDSSDYINLRVGIEMEDLTQNQSKISVGILLILHYMLDVTSLYKFEVFSGQIIKKLNECIPLKKLGYESADATVVSMFQLKKGERVHALSLMPKDATTRARECVFTANFESLVEES